jgi:hypothetical protein
LINLCEIYHTTKNEKGLKNTLTKYKETDLLFYAIISAYYEKDYDNTLLVDINKNLADFRNYMKIMHILDSNDKFELGLAIVLNRKQIDQRSARSIYDSWLQECDYINI